MADSVTSTYAGQAAEEYVAAAVLSPKSLEGLTVKDNVDYKLVVKKDTYSVALANASTNSDCDYSSSGDITVTERILAPERFKVNKTVCKTDFYADWDRPSMGASAHLDNPPATFTDYFIGRLAAGVGAEIETDIWTGINATAGEIDGFETLFAADGDVVDVTAGTFTSSNIDDRLNNALDNVPDAIKGSPNLRIYMNSASLWIYKQFLVANGHGGINIHNSDINALNYMGVPIVECPGMSANRFVIAEYTNLWFGTNLRADFNEVKVIDTSETLGDDNVRFVMKLAFGVQYGIGSEIVWANT